MIPQKLQSGQKKFPTVARKINEIIDYEKSARVKGDGKHIGVKQTPGGTVVYYLGGSSPNRLTQQTVQGSGESYNHPFKMYKNGYVVPGISGNISFLNTSGLINFDPVGLYTSGWCPNVQQGTSGGYASGSIIPIYASIFPHFIAQVVKGRYNTDFLNEIYAGNAPEFFKAKIGSIKVGGRQKDSSGNQTQYYDFDIIQQTLKEDLFYDVERFNMPLTVLPIYSSNQSNSGTFKTSGDFQLSGVSVHNTVYKWCGVKGSTKYENGGSSSRLGF